MEEQLISFETAKLAKEKGFDSMVNNFFYENEEGEVVSDNGDGDSEFICLNHNTYSRCYSRPTQSTLQKWLREVNIINAWAVPNINENLEYGFIVFKGTEDVTSEEGFTEFKTYEEALEIGLQEGLKQI